LEAFFGDIIGNWSYLGLFVVLMAAGFGLPLPEDIPLILSGFVVSTGQARLDLMILFGLAGVILGDSCLFLIGRRLGPAVLHRRAFRRFAKPWLVKRARKMYENHGAKILFASRFMPGIRSVMFLTAGTFKVPYWKMLVFDGSAALISVPTLIWAGYYFHDSIKEVFENARVASYVIGGAAVAALIAWGFWEYYHNLRKKNRPAEIVDEPPSGILAEATAPFAKDSDKTPAAASEAATPPTASRSNTNKPLSTAKAADRCEECD